MFTTAASSNWEELLKKRACQPITSVNPRVSWIYCPPIRSSKIIQNGKNNKKRPSKAASYRWLIEWCWHTDDIQPLVSFRTLRKIKKNQQRQRCLFFSPPPFPEWSRNVDWVTSRCFRQPNYIHRKKSFESQTTKIFLVWGTKWIELIDYWLINESIDP